MRTFFILLKTGTTHEIKKKMHKNTQKMKMHQIWPDSAKFVGAAQAFRDV